VTTEVTPITDMFDKYQLFPPLTDEEYQSLKHDIAEHGILVPVEIDETGEILDGHHRVRAWRELRAEGVHLKDYPRLIRVNLTEPEKLNHIRSLNLLRRHLTTEQQKPHWEDMRKAGMTYQAIANVSGVSHETVRQSLNNGTFNNLKVDGKDGKERPAKYKPRQPKTVMALDSRESDMALGAIKQAGEALPDKIVTTNRAKRISRENHNTEIPEDDNSNIPVNCDLRLGDFRQVLTDIAPESVDLIFTDPPYDNTEPSRWVDLSVIASKVLKPGGMLVTYSGQTYLPTIMKALESQLKYIWLGALVIRDGPRNTVHPLHIWCTIKPILFYTKPPYVPGTWFTDTYIDRQGYKENHAWEQTIEAPLYFIEKLTMPGETVLDPFLGTGTNAIASAILKRNFIGCEINQGVLGIAKQKITEATRNDG